MKLGNKYLGIKIDKEMFFYIKLYILGGYIMAWCDNHPMPFTILKDRIWWGTLNILWNRSISHD